MPFLKKFAEEKKGQGNWLEIDLPANAFYFEEDRERFDNREDAEAYLVSQYNVSPDEAKRIIDTGAPYGGFNLDKIAQQFSPEINLRAILQLQGNIAEIGKAVNSLKGNTSEAVKTTQEFFSSEHPIMYLLKEAESLLDKLGRISNGLSTEGRKL